MPIQTKLISWYLKNKRDFPWRKTKDPYKIWVSEIILQQTKAATGVLHYNKFLKEFPTLKKLLNQVKKKFLKHGKDLGIIVVLGTYCIQQRSYFTNMRVNFQLTFKHLSHLEE
tara:strand:- start:173 stop:511 length:339 start_codon:yes stop_codon:yes gene_type:complete